MPRNTPMVTSLALLVIASSRLCSQISPHGANSAWKSQIDSNTNRLQVTVELDRTVYFPGEAAGVSITVRNPTRDVLDVWEPFHPSCGSLDLWKKGGGAFPTHDSEFAPIHPDGLLAAAPLPDCPSTLLRAGETRRIDLRSDDEKLGILGGPALRLRALSPGAYRAVYRYARQSSAEFEIATPLLESWASAREERPVLQPDGTMIHAQYYPVAFVLLHGSRRYLCVSYANAGLREAELRSTSVYRALDVLQPYVRIAGLEEPLASMELILRPPQRFEVRWRSASGRIGLSEKEIRQAAVRPRGRRPVR